jgi:hypothetical protein
VSSEVQGILVKPDLAVLNLKKTLDDAFGRVESIAATGRAAGAVNKEIPVRFTPQLLELIQHYGSLGGPGMCCAGRLLCELDHDSHPLSFVSCAFACYGQRRL